MNVLMNLETRARPVSPARGPAHPHRGGVLRAAVKGAAVAALAPVRGALAALALLAGAPADHGAEPAA